jgi:hypothetical protein
MSSAASCSFTTLDLFQACYTQMIRAPSFRFLSGERVGIHKADWRKFNQSAGLQGDQLPTTKSMGYTIVGIALSLSF